MALVLKPSVTVRLSPQLGYWRLVAKQVTGQAMAEELNSIGRKARTQVRRLLAQQTLMPYGEVSGFVNMQPAHAGNLRVVIRVRGTVPTLGRFMTSYTQRPASWRSKGWRQTMRLKVWEGGKRFPYSGTRKPFVIEGSKLIAVRTGKGRLPIKVLSGPHLPNETLRKGKPTAQFVTVALPADFNKRVIARIGRIMAAGK